MVQANPQAQRPSANVIRQFIRHKNWFIPEPPSKSFLQGLFHAKKRAISFSNARQMDPTMGKSPFLNGNKIWNTLREHFIWKKWLPDEFTAGTSRFTLDLVNSWSGGDLQSFVVGIGRAIQENMDALRADAALDTELDIARANELCREDAELAALMEQ